MPSRHSGSSAEDPSPYEEMSSSRSESRAGAIRVEQSARPRGVGASTCIRGRCAEARGATVSAVTAEPALDHVQIAAPPGSEEQARAFYGEAIGLTELPKPVALRSRGGVWFALAGAQLHVGIEANFKPARKAHPAFGFGCEGLRAVAERVAAAGAPVHWDDELPKVLRFFTEDPWGNRLELLAHHA